MKSKEEKLIKNPFVIYLAIEMSAQSSTCLSTKDGLIKDKQSPANQHEEADDRILVHVSDIAIGFNPYRVLICSENTGDF